MGEEINYNQLFDIEDAGAEGTEAAEPSEDSQVVEGEEAGEVAEPSEEISQEPGADEGTGEDDGADGQGEQSPEERARFAAARRKAEAQRDEAVANARKEAAEGANRFLDEAFAKSGMVNPYTRQPIRSKADFDAFDAQRLVEQQKEFARKAGMSDEQYKEFVSSLPEVQEANKAKAQAEQAQQAAREQQARARLDEQVKAISKLDPGIKSLEDVVKSENYDQVIEMVNRGYSLEDAYKIANFDRLSQRNVAAAKQQAANSARGKSHMGVTAARGAGAVTVPEDVKAEYRAMIPGITDAEIQKHYASYTKKR